MPFSAPAADGGRADVPRFRVQEGGWGSGGVRDISAVLNSAARQLWKQFPGYEIEPMAVVRGNAGPITLFQRNVRGDHISTRTEVTLVAVGRTNLLHARHNGVS